MLVGKKGFGYAKKTHHCKDFVFFLYNTFTIILFFHYIFNFTFLCFTIIIQQLLSQVQHFTLNTYFLLVQEQLDILLNLDIKLWQNSHDKSLQIRSIQGSNNHLHKFHSTLIA